MSLRLTRKAPQAPRPLNQKISARLDAQVVHPLGQTVHRTAFSALYSKGGIPWYFRLLTHHASRLQHGSVKHKLQWQTEPSALNYNPILITFFEGLLETRHPYIFVVRQGILELLDAPGAQEKIRPLIGAFVIPLRTALSTKNMDLYRTCLICLQKLAALVGPLLCPHLGLLLPPMANKVLSSDIQVRELTYQVLGECERDCGPDALKIIRSRVPTYSSIHILK